MGFLTKLLGTETKKKLGQKIETKQYEVHKRRALIRKENEENRELKQKERIQKRENVAEDIDLGRFFELTTSNKIYVNRLFLHENKNEILEDYTSEFELIGSMMIAEIEQNTN